jgi:hypothetical protein
MKQNQTGKNPMKTYERPETKEVFPKMVKTAGRQNMCPELVCLFVVLLKNERQK